MKLIIIFLLTAFAALMVYPFLWLAFGSFKTGSDIISQPIQLLPREWTLDGFRLVWGQSGLPRAYFNSMFVSSLIVFSTLLTSSLGGYVFARLQFPGRQLLFYFILATTMVPFVTLLIPLYLVMLDLGLLNSYAALWIPAGVSSFGIFLCRQFILGIPLDLYEAAKIDGAGDFRIYWEIILPLIRPVLSALAIFSFLGAFNSYLWPLVVLNNQDLYTLPLILVQISTSMGATNYQAVMAGSLLASIPTIVVYLIFQRNFVRGIALSGIKG
ncbi:MAG: carbohydrate ABC transporter permease [Chloroflexota bacterium]|nr:carbohydrate ABC transporter permease [Chloroflexia bacterium]MDQ3443046.1 carbohydrate ABC transporter permease [Chloroflexota bacterium]